MSRPAAPAARVARVAPAALAVLAAPAALAVLAALACPRAAFACAPAPPPGVPVQIADEAAIIAWDEQSHTEHFIRRASFRTAAADFGFLVPTPSVPTLREAGDAVFDTLEEMVKPEVVRRGRFDGFELTAICAMSFSKSESAPGAPPEADGVRVLASQRVAGYDAVVLEAGDASALAKWLDERGYAKRPDLVDWLDPYVKARWKMTAFRMAPGARDEAGATGRVDASAVHMSFATDRPFFPYREPLDQRTTLHAALPPAERARSLHVFFFGPSRFSGAIDGGTPWPGETRWADAVDPARLPDLLSFPLPPGTWLTAFRDTASPRPGTNDLFFSPGADRSPVRPQVIIDEPYKIPILLDVLFVFGLGGWFVFVVVKRLKQVAARRG